MMEELVATLTKNEDSLHRIRKTEGFHNEVRRFIAQNDLDGNGKLDEAEFVKAMKRFGVQEGISTDPDQSIEIQAQIESALYKRGSTAGSFTSQ